VFRATKPALRLVDVLPFLTARRRYTTDLYVIWRVRIGIMAGREDRFRLRWRRRWRPAGL
jgi:hypothetical protein